MYKFLFFIIFFSSMGLGFLKTKEQFWSGRAVAAPEISNDIGLASFLQLINEGNIIIVDMRRPQDYRESHIKNALSAHLAGLAGEGENPGIMPGDARNVVIYSNGGINDQMRHLGEILARRGMDGVLFYSGGFHEWKAAGLPTERGD